MLANLKFNELILKDYIERYNNKTVYGIKITRAGILAGAQFGPGMVMEFFDRTGKRPLRDGNGVHIGYYMKKFSKYKLPKKIKI
jgi:flagellar basal body rod protein FlgB